MGSVLSTTHDSEERFKTVTDAVFQQQGLLQEVLDFAGAGQWLFVAPVSSDWKQGYEQVQPHMLLGINQDEHDVDVLCTPRMTLCRAAFASPARVRLAHEQGGLLLAELQHRQLQHIAGRYAGISTLAAAHELGMPWTQSVANGSAESGCLPTLTWLYAEQKCPLPPNVSTDPARSGNISRCAASSGNVEMLAWLKSIGCDMTVETSREAVNYGHTHVLQWLYEQNSPWGEEVCDAAAAAGNLPVLQWLRAHGCPWSAYSVACNAAHAACCPAKTVELLRWMKQQEPAEVSFDANTMALAAERGHVAVCEYLRSEDCAWSSKAATAAAAKGHTALLRWLRMQRCPWTSSAVCASAATSGSTECMAFALEHAPTADAAAAGANLSEMLSAAGAHGHLEAAAWLRLRGAQWPAALQYAELSWPAATVQWAQQQGYVAATTTLALVPITTAAVAAGGEVPVA